MNQSANNGNDNGRILVILFLMILFSGFVADRILVGIDAKKMPEEFTDHEFLLHPYKMNFHFKEMACGDLTDFRTRRKYGRERRFDFRTDRYGFMTPQGTTPENSDIVIIGDSFTQGSTNEGTVAGIVTGMYGHKVYNMGFGGYPANSALAFMEKYPLISTGNASKSMKKKTLIFLLCKRNITSDTVGEIIPRAAMSPKKLKKKKLAREIFRYFPHNIVKFAKRHSVLVERASLMLTNVNEFLGKASPNPKIIVGKDRMLFIPEDVNYFDNHKVGDASWQVFIQTMQFMKAQAAARGFDLLVVLTPDKSDVYPQYLPAGMRRRHSTKPSEYHVRSHKSRFRIPTIPTLPDKDDSAYFMSKMESELNIKGICAVNLLPDMRAQALRNGKSLLYYYDDTHWNPSGMQVAADQIQSLREGDLGCGLPSRYFWRGAPSPIRVY